MLKKEVMQIVDDFPGMWAIWTEGVDKMEQRQTLREKSIKKLQEKIEMATSTEKLEKLQKEVCDKKKEKKLKPDILTARRNRNGQEERQGRM